MSDPLPSALAVTVTVLPPQTSPLGTKKPSTRLSPLGGAVGYPVRFNGFLDPQLSRGLWLVKWLLAIPHFIILAMLWFTLLVTTVAAGIMILFDQPFQVGDRVKFGETYGEVKEIGLRAVRIVTLDDNEVSIPNNKFLTEAVASANGGALDMMVVIRFYIAVTEDFELAKRIVHEACLTSKYVFLKKRVIMAVREEGRDGMFFTTILTKGYVIDARYEEAFMTDVTERVKRAFRRHNILPPYAREMGLEEIDWGEPVRVVKELEP